MGWENHEMWCNLKFWVYDFLIFILCPTAEVKFWKSSSLDETKERLTNQTVVDNWKCPDLGLTFF